MSNETLPRGGYGWSDTKPIFFQTDIKDSAEKVFEMFERKEFDAIAFTGSSGAALAFYASAHYGIPLIYVRKTGEKSHGLKVESNSTEPVFKYLIVDDFIDSGKTIRNIVRKIEKWCIECEVNTHPKPVGVFFWSTRSSHPGTVMINKKDSIPVYKL